MAAHASSDGADEIDRLLAEADGMADLDDGAPGLAGEGAGDGRFPEVNRDYQLLKQAMVNEMAAPDLLPFKGDLVWNTRSLLKEQEEGLAAQATQSVELAAVSTIYLLEADRVRYVLSNYLRTRLHKIRSQAYALVGMQSRARRELLSKEEETFVERLLVALGDHLTDEVLAQVPEKYAAGIEEGMASQPSHQHMVFVEAVTDIGDVTVPGAADGSESQTVAMERGTTFVLPFSIARPLVAADKLVLMCDTRQVQ